MKIGTRPHEQVICADLLGSGKRFDLEVRLGAGAYICGEETSLLDSLEGKRGQVRPKPPLPAIKGLFGQPTIINNVITLASVPIILDKGAEYYRDFGMGRSRGTLPLQLAGNIKHGGLVEKAFGVTLRELLYDYGGGSASGRPIRAVQVGGPLGSYLPESQFDTPIDYESFAAIKGMLGHGGIVVFDDSVDLVAVAHGVARFLAVESCGQCTPCKQDGLAMAELLDRIRRSEANEIDLVALNDRVLTVADSARCNLALQQQLVIGSLLRMFPEAVREHLDGARRAADAYVIASVVDIVDGRAVVDVGHERKQPDWTYNETTSGASPADLIDERAHHHDPH